LLHNRLRIVFHDRMARIPRTALAVLTACTLGAGLLPGAASAAPEARPISTVGGNGAGDPYFPLQGNTGYDVKHYWINLRYAPHHNQALAGHVRLRAVAHRTLSRFNLDLRSAMRVHSVRVNGHAASFGQPAKSKHELVIRPHRLLHRGRSFWVSVDYSGHGRAIYDPDGSPDGWIPTNDGAFVANEPQGTPSWYPVNDTPRDKARYSVSVDVPRGLAAISNGALIGRSHHGTRVRWNWQLHTPISSYLVTATVGHFALHRGHVGKHLPYIVAVDPAERSGTRRVLHQLPRIIRFFSAKYGRYPFGQAGAIVDHAPNVGYALETATRPLFPGSPSVGTLAHELAHQWYGDDVTCGKWRHIWLNEGFAQFSEWLWQAHNGGLPLRKHLRLMLAHNTDFDPPPGNPGSNKAIFAGSVYDRGAGALEALREKLGNGVFFKIMRGWLRVHRYGNASVQGFTRYAAQVSHRHLTHFFYVWLYRPGKPSL
jgi:aminopeptidase N